MNFRSIQVWKDSVKFNDPWRIAEVLSLDAVLHSPVMFLPVRGQSMILKYLAGASRTLNGPDMRYVGEWRSENGAVLEFETKHEETTINGVDIFNLDLASGRITAIKVMIRPIAALQLVHRLMGAELQAMIPIPER